MHHRMTDKEHMSSMPCVQEVYIGVPAMEEVPFEVSVSDLADLSASIGLTHRVDSPSKQLFHFRSRKIYILTAKPDLVFAFGKLGIVVEQLQRLHHGLPNIPWVVPADLF